MDDSTEEDRRRCCVGKRHYRTSSEARKAAKRTNRSASDRTVRAYSCPYCLMFHVGGRDRHPLRIEVYEDGRAGWRSVVYDGGGIPVAEFKANEKKHATFLATMEARKRGYDGTGQM